MLRIYSLLFFLISLSWVFTANAQEPSSSEILKNSQLSLDVIVNQLELSDIEDDQLQQMRGELESVRTASAQVIENIKPDLDAALSELEALGPAPAEGEDPEAESISSQRTEINARIGELEGQVTEAELVQTRVRRLLGKLSEVRRSRFSQRLFARGPSPLSIKVWQQALPQIVDASSAIREAFNNIFSSDPVRTQVRDSGLAIGFAALIAILFSWPLHSWLLSRFGRDPNVKQPGFMEAMRAMVVVGVVRALLPTAAAALIYIVAINNISPSSMASGIAGSLFLGFIFFAWVVAFFRASLSPANSAWRVLPVPDNFASGMWRFVILLALVYALDIVLSEVFTIYGARLEINVLRDFLIALIVIILLAILLLRQDMWRPSEPESTKPRWRSTRMIMALTLMLFPVIGAFGYVALMKYVATQALLTGGLFLLLLILHRLGKEFITQLTTGDNRISTHIRDSLHFDTDSLQRLEFWAGIIYDFLIVSSGLLVGLFIWGANSDEVGSWINQALFGFQIGRINIALVDIAIAILLVVILIIVTRFFQRMLAEQVLPQTRLDVGIRESLRQATGYVGLVIAAIVGISALGLDLSNFALIAGALTVGIGFGLQNVVNNFVSGLILLIERPVKVGDWIVVGDMQGYVKQIRVRATEIQTFDRATVFIPNSELISGVVTNWTHADKLGRVIIPIGVAYGSDTELVKKTLIEIATSHPQVLADPGPAAVFRGFGDSSLNFELRVVLEDVEKTLSVTSELCFAIDKAFRKAEIEIPFPQQDVYIRKGPE